jgi:hypothetical protein
MVLHQHAIEKGRDIRRSLDRAIGVEHRSGPHYVVGLPLSRLAVRVHQRNRLLIDARRHPVHVSRVLVGIENLQLVSGVARTGGRQK